MTPIFFYTEKRVKCTIYWFASSFLPRRYFILHNLMLKNWFLERVISNQLEQFFDHKSYQKYTCNVLKHYVIIHTPTLLHHVHLEDVSLLFQHFLPKNELVFAHAEVYSMKRYSLNKIYHLSLKNCRRIYSKMSFQNSFQLSRFIESESESIYNQNGNFLVSSS